MGKECASVKRENLGLKRNWLGVVRMLVRFQFLKICVNWLYLLDDLNSLEAPKFDSVRWFSLCKGGIKGEWTCI